MSSQSASLVVVHATASTRAAAEGGFDERFLAAKQALGGVGIVVGIPSEVKKAVDGIADQLLTVWNTALAGLPGGEV